MRFRHRALVGAVALMGSALLATPAPAAVSRQGLHVSGNRIVDSAGHTVVLRGVNRAGTEGGSGTSGLNVADSEIGWLAHDHPGSWDSTAIRVLVGEAQWTGACPKLSSQTTTYVHAIDREIAAITRRGLIALVDLHTSTAGCSDIARHAMPDYPVADQFWASAAKRYSSNRLVAFELYNEPHYVTEGVWRNGTAKATFQDCDPRARVGALAMCQASQPHYRAAGMQALYSIVAKAAPGHLIVVDGLDYATLPPVTPLAGHPVYGVHPYTCANPGACQTSTNDHANTTVLNRWKKLSARAPIWITEFGFPTQTPLHPVSGARYFSETIAFLNAQKPAWGWLAFAFDGKDSGAFKLTTSTTTYAPNTTGKPVFTALHQGS